MLIHDIRNALRSLAKSPGFTFAAALTLALGIGANTAIFSVINDVLVRDLPYAGPERLVMVWEHNSARDWAMNVVSPANFLDWRDRSTSFAAMAGFYDRSFTLTGEGEPDAVMATAVTPNLFDMLGAHAQVGRLLNAEDEKLTSPRSVVLSHKYWKKRFNGDPSVVGRAITLTGTPSNIVGVLPEEFGFYVKEASFNSAPADLWVQARFDDSDRIRRGRYMSVLGQLKPGVTLDQATAEMKTIASSLEAQYQSFNKDWTVNLVPLRQQFTGEIRPALLMVFGAVCLTLFIACANVANLQLVRASTRSREFTVRAALGASRSRLIRFLLTESVVLAFIGGAGGLVLGTWGLSALQSLMPKDLLPSAYIGLDARVFSFALGLSLLTGVLFGLIPALIASRPQLAEALKEGSRGTTSAAGRRLRQVFVTAQVAVALVVLIGAGLLARSFDRLVASDTGFDTSKLLTARLTLPGSTYKEPAQVQAFFEGLIGRIKALPGVKSATGNVFAPFSGPGAATSFEIVGRPVPAGQEPVTDVRVVAADYFTTLRIPLLQGRTFQPEEIASKRGVVIISEALARKQFPGQNPLGQKLVINMMDSPTPSEVIGVVGDIRHKSLDEAPREMVYWPHAELTIPMMTVLVRTQSDPLLLAPSLQREVWALDPNLPVPEPRTMEQLVAGTVTRARFATLLFGLFATLALVLSALGIYGVVSYRVALDTRDIGIRMALGATRSQVLREVLGDGGRLAALGLLAGVVGALGLTRLLTSQLYEITATDPATFIGMSLALLLVAVLACWAPARRAAGIEPIEALRTE